MFLLFFVELLIAGSQAVDGAGFSVIRVGLQKANFYHFDSFGCSI